MNDWTGALQRNGIVIERARREGRSLSYEERMIIASGRDLARSKGCDQVAINMAEFGASLDHETVLKPIKVRATFAFYHEPYEDIPAEASYCIVESNHPALPQGGNVGADQLIKARIGIPLTPLYRNWVKNGRKCYRGGKV